MGAGLCWKGLTLVLPFLLGKTCFPACWHPVESWSAATWGVKTWKPSRVRGVETKMNVMYKTPAPSWVSGVCSECHWQARFHHNGVASATLWAPL